MNQRSSISLKTVVVLGLVIVLLLLGFSYLRTPVPKIPVYVIGCGTSDADYREWRAVKSQIVGSETQYFVEGTWRTFPDCVVHQLVLPAHP